ncbi:MAG: hypothetical protein RLZZ414_863, partial [Bacteroidota bacterium]
KEFIDELSKYKQGKGSVQFPLNQPIPYALIEKIVRFRVKENTTIKKKNNIEKNFICSAISLYNMLFMAFNTT